MYNKVTWSPIGRISFMNFKYVGFECDMRTKYLLDVF